MGNINFGFLLAVSLTVLRLPALGQHEFLSEVHAETPGFTTAVISWNVETPGDSWIETQLRARIGSRWTSWYDMGHWSGDRTSGNRHSVNAPADADGHVDTDTLSLRLAAAAWQAHVVYHSGSKNETPVLSLLAVTTGDASPTSQAESDRRAWGLDIDVPQRTQHVNESPDQLGGGGDSWCSPTSVSMVMAYWAERTNHPQWNIDVPSAAAGTYDSVYDGCGNWPFNVAFASEHGLAGWVERLRGLSDIERYISADMPIIASIKVAQGELHGSPYAKSDGHLLVVRGFTADGDVIVNDPAGRLGSIRRIYERSQFEHVWMNGSHGIVYVIGPPELLKTLRP